MLSGENVKNVARAGTRISQLLILKAFVLHTRPRGHYEDKISTSPKMAFNSKAQ